MTNITPECSTNTTAEQTQNNISSEIKSIFLFFSKMGSNLSIPHYQRPYRWEEKNVEQLLDDIQKSWASQKSTYRIGSVILHNNNNTTFDIVDGQQRITTLLVILNQHFFKEFVKVKEIKFPELKYNHTDSSKHIRENYNFIDKWFENNIPSQNQKEDFLKYLLYKCEFVVITVDNLSEAFQMFDSQNGRGKELEAYNLLKAYHIRAMEQNSEEEKIKCDQRWEDATQYNATIDILKQLFDEQLYRSRCWSRKESADKFSKKKIDEFKGVTIDKKHPTIYPYQNPQLLQYLTAKFYHNILKRTIANRFEYGDSDNIDPFANINQMIANRFEHGDSENIDPFANINQTIVNGKPFFDYVETFVEIYKRLFLNLGSSELSEFKLFYYQYCLSYDFTDKATENYKAPNAHLPRGGACRSGDTYLRELYKSLIFVLFDRFGEKGLNRYYGTLYRLIYKTRLEQSQVRYSTVAQLPQKLDNCFAVIAQAKESNDLRILEKTMLKRISSDNKFTNIDAKIINFIKDGDTKSE